MPTFREGGPEEDDAILPEQVLQQTLAFCHSTQVLATVNPSNCVVHRCPTSTSTSRTNSGNISCTEEGPINSALTHNHSIPTSIHGFRPVATLGRGNKGTVVLVIAKQTGAPFALKINSCRESSDVDPVMVMDQSNVSMQMKAKKNQDIHLLLSHVDAAADHNISDHYDDHPLLPDRCDGNEKEILSLLRPHPFLQTLHGHFESGKHSLLLLDFCSGGDLHRLQYKQPEKRFSETAARFYAAEVLVALEQLHNTGIVYRDLKPENILIQENGHIKLTDFDLSLKLVRSSSNGGALMPDKASGTASTLQLKKGKIDHEHQVNDSIAGIENVVLEQELAIVKGLMAHDVVKDMACMRRLGGCFLFEQDQDRGGEEEDDEEEEKGETADDEVVEAEKFCESKLMEARRIRRRGGMVRRDVHNKKEGLNIRKMMAERKKKIVHQKSVCFVGTDEYVAPEVLRGGDHTAAMDWWSYGVLLYEMIYGNTPFRGKNSDETLHNIMEKDAEFPGIVSAAKNLISQLLVKEASKRPRVEEIKRHEFFRGLQWELLTEVARPPFIPPPYSLSEFEDRARRNQQLIRFNPNNSMSRSSSSSTSSSHQNNTVPWIDEVALIHRGGISNSSSSAAASHNLSASTHTQSSASSALSLSSCGAMEYCMNSLHREESLEYMSISQDQDPWTGDQVDLINQQKALWKAC